MRSARCGAYSEVIGDVSRSGVGSVGECDGLVGRHGMEAAVDGTRRVLVDETIELPRSIETNDQKHFKT